MNPSHSNRRPGSRVDDPPADLIFAMVSAMAHAVAALDADRAEYPDEPLSHRLRRVWPKFRPHAERVADVINELRGRTA